MSIQASLTPQPLRPIARYPSAGHSLVTLLGLLSFVLALAALLPFTSRWLPKVAILENFAAQIAFAGGAVGLLLLLRRRWAMAAPALVGACVGLVQVWPHLLPVEARAAAGPSPQAAIKIVSLNMHASAPDFRQTVAYLRDSGAEVIGLVEVNPLARIELDGLRDIYPFRIDCIGSVPQCEEMLLSKRPFRHGFAGRFDPAMPAAEGRAPVVAWGEIEWNGRPLTLAVTHICRPFAPATASASGDGTTELPATAQAEQAAALAGALAGLGHDLALMGDFNGVPWSRVQTSFRRRTGLADQGHMALSWPGFLWPAFRLPIDQVLVRGDLDLISLDTGGIVDSDHLPIVAEIAWHLESAPPSHSVR